MAIYERVLKRVFFIALLLAMVFMAATIQIEAGTTEAQADFMVSLEVSPEEIYAGETTTVIVQIKNTASVDGTYEAVLKVNGIEEEEKSARINPRGTGSIEFKISKATPGEYSVDVNGLEGSFVVLEGANPSQPSSSLPVILIVVASVAIIGTIVFLLLRRKNTTAH
ncbi:MAG: hypothetical protein WC231_03335 [Dehalococcoidales bacterium]